MTFLMVLWRLCWPVIFYGIAVDTAALFLESQGPLACTLAGAGASLPFLIWAYRKGEGRKDRWRALSPKEVLLWSLGGIGGCILVNTVIRISGIAGIFTGFSRVSAELYRPSPAFQICAVGVGIPLAEELVFRGLMFGEARREWSFCQAAVITSLLFGIYHGNVLQGIYGFCMGMVFAWGMEEMGTVLVPVLMHVWANMASVIITWLAKGAV